MLFTRSLTQHMYKTKIEFVFLIISKIHLDRIKTFKLLNIHHLSSNYRTQNTGITYPKTSIAKLCQEMHEHQITMGTKTNEMIHMRIASEQNWSRQTTIDETDRERESL